MSTPTPEEFNAAGDALLEALVRTTDHQEPEVGDLVIEVTSFSLDWERVGYLLEVPENVGDPCVVWSVGQRVTRWRNASFWRLGTPGMRLRSLPYPTPEQLLGKP